MKFASVVLRAIIESFSVFPAEVAIGPSAGQARAFTVGTTMTESSASMSSKRAPTSWRLRVASMYCSAVTREPNSSCACT